MVHDTGRQADGWWVASKYCGGPWRVVGTEKRNIRGQSLIAKEIPRYYTNLEHDFDKS